MKSFYLFSTFVSVFLLFLFVSFDRNEITLETSSPEGIRSSYIEDVNKLKAQVDEMVKLSMKIDASSMKIRCIEARREYKKIEWLVEYLYRESGLKINGPNLLEAEIHQPLIPLYPTGFQVVEETIFAETYSKSKVKVALDGLQNAIDQLVKNPHFYLSEGQCFQAMKMAVYRLITKGITGFDAPSFLAGIKEGEVVLLSIQNTLTFFDNTENIQKKVKESALYLNQFNGSFDEFDRFTFLKEYLNPLCDLLAKYSTDRGLDHGTLLRLPVKANTGSLFEDGAFDVLFYAPSDALLLKENTVALGERLFKDKRLSLDDSRACIDCHSPSKGFSDGLRKNVTPNKTDLLRNTPTLFNSGLQNAQFADSRLVFLEDQIHAVIRNKDEMGGKFDRISEELKKDLTIRKEFKKIFGNNRLNDRQIKLVLAAFVRSLIAMNSEFDKGMRGEKELSSEIIKGFNLFAGKAKCATCHYIPLFNGSAPPTFDKMESEVLGVPAEKEKLNAIIDPDLGKYNLYGIPHQKHSFKTPSIRNLTKTGPYMHNGVFSTLREVIDFYNVGGGFGYNLEVENQTLPKEELNLTELEIQNLIKFLESLEG